jgi:hypothetical protein
MNTTQPFSLEDLSTQIINIIFSFCNIVEYHVLRFVSIKIHRYCHNYNQKRILFRFHFNDPAGITTDFDEDDGSVPLIISFIVIKNGYLNILIWLYDLFNERFTRLSPNYCCRAAMAGNLLTLKWLRNKGFSWKSNVCFHAVRGGHFELLKWAKENGCEWDARTCMEAAGNGNFEIFKWLKNNGAPWDKWTCACAARNGHLKILKWARKNKCPWDSDTCAQAAGSGQFELLKWARENKCPWNAETTYAAAKNGHIEILKWASESGCHWHNHITNAAARSGNLEILKLARNYHYRNGKELVDAIEGEHLEIIKWLLDNGSYLTTESYLMIETSKNLEIKELIKGIERPQ